MAAFLTLDVAKEHLGVLDDDRDAYIDGLLDAAARHIENVTNTAPAQRDESFTFDGFPPNDVSCRPGQIILPLSPVDPDSVEIVWLDSDGAEQTLENESLRIVTINKVTRILPLVGAVWPITTTAVGSVTVSASVGFADDDVPESLNHAAKLLIGTWFANRETVAMGLVTEIPRVNDLLELERAILA